MRAVFTDLDATLLDAATYSWQEARPALTLLARREIPCVLVTSKTRAEVEELRRHLGNRDPFVVENGGAAFVPEGYFPFPLAQSQLRDSYQVIEFGTPYAEIVAALTEASSDTGCGVRAFHSLTDSEVAEWTGLHIGAARRARIREYDEPFTILNQAKADALLQALEHRGLRWTRGGRFYHALGDNDKGRAVAALLNAFRRVDPGIVSLGLGDSPNDIEFLRLMDHRVIVRAPHDQTGLVRQVSGELTREPGPRGWNEAVIDFVKAQPQR